MAHAWLLWSTVMKRPWSRSKMIPQISIWALHCLFWMTLLSLVRYRITTKLCCRWSLYSYVGQVLSSLTLLYFLFTSRALRNVKNHFVQTFEPHLSIFQITNPSSCSNRLRKILYMQVSVKTTSSGPAIFRGKILFKLSLPALWPLHQSLFF